MKSKVDMKEFELFAQDLIDRYQIPGTAIGLAQHGELVYEKGFGFRNIEQELPVTMDTVYGIASVTKSFTCVAIMQLQEQGKLSVHDPVVNYLPEFSTPTHATDQMTIHHFMTHSAGLPPLPTLVYANKRSLDRDPSVQDYPGLKIKEEEQEPIDTYEQLMSFIGGLSFELLGEPGTEFSYSNDSYALLGAIIERVSGRTYEEYVQEFILEPAGMTNSCFLLEELSEDVEITSLYATRKKENGDGTEVYEAPVWWDSPAMRAAGYLKSTIRDMLNYAEIFRNHGRVGTRQILSLESVQQMIYPHIECSPGRYYGYGFMVTPNYFGSTLVEHGGNLKAIASQLCIIPEKGITGMILTNLAGVPASTLLSGALNDLEGRNPKSQAASYSDYECAGDKLVEYTGTYSSNEGMSLTIAVKDSALEMTAQDSTIPLRCVGEDLFLAHVRDQQEVMRFIRDEQGNVIRIAYHFRQFPKKGNE